MNPAQFLQRVCRARWYWVGVAIITLIAAVFCWGTIRNYCLFFGMYHDDSIYMVCSKALSEGLGYRIISLPTEPIQSKYPIGFPLFLAVLWKIFPHFPENLLPISSVQAFLGVSSGILMVCYMLATRKLTPLLALAILGATLLNTRYLEVAPMILSNFSTFLLGAICAWRTDVLARRKCSTRDAVWLGLLLVTPVLVRVQGLAVPLACLVSLAFRKQLRLAIIAGLVCAPFILGQTCLLWWLSLKAPQFLDWYTRYLPHKPVIPELDRFLNMATQSIEWSRFMENGTAFPFLNSMMVWHVNPVFLLLLYGPVYLVLFLILCAGWLREVRRASVPGFGYLFNILPIVVFPVLLEWRHFAAGLPIIYFFYFQGFRVISGWIKRFCKPPRRLYAGICAVISVLFSVYLVSGAFMETMVRDIRFAQNSGFNAPRISPLAGNGDYAEAFYWISKNTELSDVFMCNDDPLFYLYTGHKAIVPWRIDFVTVFTGKMSEKYELESIKFAHPKYLMDDPMYRHFGQGLGPAEWLALTLDRVYPGSVVPVFHSSRDLITIWKIVPDKLPL